MPAVPASRKPKATKEVMDRIKKILSDLADKASPVPAHA